MFHLYLYSLVIFNHYYIMQPNSNSAIISVDKIYKAHKKTKQVVAHTKLMKSNYLSNKYNANVYLKRQDLQAVRSFKIRGAANAILNLTQQQKERGIVTASAGNHAQGVAYCCNKLKIKGAIFMPLRSPLIKCNAVKSWGGQYVQIFLVGNTFDESLAQARKYQTKNGSVFVHAFDNPKVIQGQGGIAVQILQDWEGQQDIDYVFCCVGGGGLISGIGCYFKHMSPNTKIVGFEPLGSPSMYQALKQDKVITLDKIDTFVDGAAIKRTSQRTFDIVKELGIDVKLSAQGLVSKSILQLYNYQGIVLQPAGALSVSGLQLCKQEIKGKNVVCILSGSNNQISRLPEMRLRSRLYEEMQAYYLIKLGDSQGKMKQFVKETIRLQQQDIIMLNYSKKHNHVNQCLLGLEFVEPIFKKEFQSRLKSFKFEFIILTPEDPMFQLIIK